MADLSDIKENARLLASFDGRDSLPAQRIWLEQQFKTAAGQGIEGAIETTQATTESTSHTFQYRGSTVEERATGLRMAIYEIRAEIAAVNSGLDPRPRVGCLMPRFYS